MTKTLRNAHVVFALVLSRSALLLALLLVLACFPMRAFSQTLEVGGRHSCAILSTGDVKCWGESSAGQTGYDTQTDIGCGAGCTAMAALGTVNLGAGRTATAITTGDTHTCAILDTGDVKCWGDSRQGRTGYDMTTYIGNGFGTAMAALGTVFLGAGRTATAITAGTAHTCAILDTGDVKCWGDSRFGKTGYDTETDIGDGIGTTMAALGTVFLGVGRTATAITADSQHTCAILDTGDVKCWGLSSAGRTGYDTVVDIGCGGACTTMAALGTVFLGAGRTATAITAGTNYTCAILDTGDVKCWGGSGSGVTGYDTTTDIGCGGGCTAMAALGTVNLGAGRTATAITAVGGHTCALLDTGDVKCWGLSISGQTGYDTTTSIGCGGFCTTMAALGTVFLGGVALPVELVAFTVVLDGPDALLAWQTASETNNAGFEVQIRNSKFEIRNSDWQVLGFVEGHGTTLEPQSYTFRIEDLLPGRHVFRLKQIDFDGAFEYSPEVEVIVGVPGSHHLTAAYPNPFKSQATFTLALRAAQPVKITLYDALGRRVMLLHEGALTAGTVHRFTVEGSQLTSGLYHIGIEGKYFRDGRVVMLVK